ncbi:hypothetical protein SSPS47_26890 [Streptomyces sp. S4.7]|nr:hypothetical protein SSPS47_26890 [Streptomyces sp. S4.7]
MTLNYLRFSCKIGAVDLSRLIVVLPFPPPRTGISHSVDPTETEDTMKSKHLRRRLISGISMTGLLVVGLRPASSASAAGPPARESR